MIKVIGNIGCSKCINAKSLLDEEGIEYEYLLYQLLSEEDQDKYRNLIFESGNLNFPIIVKNDELITLEEILENV